MKAVIFDIDGTLANIQHRRMYVASKPKNWRAFNLAMVNDTVYPDILELYNLFKEAGYTMIIVSGRSEESRKVTEEWLAKYEIVYTKLYMRPLKDNRSDAIVKQEILQQILENGYVPLMAIDDRNRVVNMWRSNGIRCLQVCDGDY